MSKLTVTSNGGAISLSGDRVQIVDCSFERAFSVKGDFLDIERNLFSMTSTINGSYSTIRANSFPNNGYDGLSLAGQYNLITDNTGTNVGLQVFACSSYIANNKFNGSSHFFTLSGNNNVVCGNTLSHYAYGLAITGLNNTILKNTITHCGQALLPNANNTCYANYIANNSWGLDTGGPLGSVGGGLLYNNSFVGNTYQVNTLFPAKADFFDNGKFGNYWSDYHGADSNGDGIGDTPYIVDSNRSDRYPLMAAVNISAVPDLVPDWAKAPEVQLLSPTETTTYSAGDIAVDFVVDKQTTISMYSLDGGSNVTITPNTKLPNLSAGTHNITVYAADSYNTTGASETVSFTVTQSFLGFSEIIPVAAVIIAVATVAALISAALLLYRRRKNACRIGLKQ
jgi:parallel beta-helix repeat protein